MRFSFLAASLFLLPVLALAQTSLPQGPHVVAEGQGQVDTKPDLAVVDLGAEYAKDTAEAAKRAVDAGVDGYLSALHVLEIDAKDVRASDLSLSEDSDYDEKGKKVFNGYVARCSVEVTLRDVAKLNTLIDAGLAAGMNEVKDVTLGSSQEATLRAEARRKAVMDAKAKASGLAEAFGATVGAVYSINSTRSMIANGYGGAGSLDTVTVVGSRSRGAGQYIQPMVKYNEQVTAVFDIKR